MIKKYSEFYKSINEETGIRNINKIIDGYKKFEVWFHQDLDGIASCLGLSEYLKKYGLVLDDAHIIQYGGLEYAIQNKKPDTLAVLVDFAHNKTFVKIATDHHQGQTGEVAPGGSTHAKHSRSNVETISGEISNNDLFTNTDIELIRTVDSADFLKYDLKPEDIQNVLFKFQRDKSADKNRFLMGLIANRLLLIYKNKRLTVTSLDGKRDHINKNFLECLALDCTPSLYSIFNNIRHYVNNAISLEWDMSKRSHNVPKKLASVEDINKNLIEYIGTRQEEVVSKESGELEKHKDIDYDKEYGILKQYGIGSVFKSGSYDRYIVFKNFPDAKFVCTIFPMGLIQVSCNPFVEKTLDNINLGEIAKEVLTKYKYQLSNINIPVSDIKRISEDDIEKNMKKYGEGYNAIGFKFDDLKSFYKDSIIYLPNAKSGDMKTRETLDLTNLDHPVVKLIKSAIDKPYAKWSYAEKQEMNALKIPIWNIIEANSGGHKAITNIQGLNYLSSRKDLLKLLFKTENYTDIMKMFADKFISVLKEKIDADKSGKEVVYDTGGVEFKGELTLESFEYYITDNDIENKVTRDEFLEFGLTNMDGNNFDISLKDDGKVVGTIKSN